MRKVFFGNDHIITSLGFSTEENARAMLSGHIGIRICEDESLYPGPVPLSRIDDKRMKEEFSGICRERANIQSPVAHYSRLEKMLICSIAGSLHRSNIDPADPRTILILSTTKGNIDLLSAGQAMKSGNQRIHLWELAGFIAGLFHCSNRPIVVSNACISGSVAIIMAARMITTGRYDHAIVAGGDIVSEFVISGFQSFQALSPEPCKPFDANRTGLSLGEGCGTVLLTADPAKAGDGDRAHYLGGAISNDANHISGPSRDGKGLFLSISAARKESGLAPQDIDFISAHGTATPYNDEMESLALAWAGLNHVTVNSFKGYIGHTLGAAGIIETILSIYSMRNGILFRSAGYDKNGVSRPLNIITENISKPVRCVLKTASGFGGCNAAILLRAGGT